MVTKIKISFFPGLIYWNSNRNHLNIFKKYIFVPMVPPLLVVCMSVSQAASSGFCRSGLLSVFCLIPLSVCPYTCLLPVFWFLSVFVSSVYPTANCLSVCLSLSLSFSQFVCQFVCLQNNLFQVLAGSHKMGRVDTQLIGFKTLYFVSAFNLKPLLV